MTLSWKYMYTSNEPDPFDFIMYFIITSMFTRSLDETHL